MRITITGASGLIGSRLVKQLEQRLEVTRSDGDGIELRAARLSGGIVLKNETLGTEAWLTELSTAMVAEAERSEQTRQALERLLIDD